MTTAAILDAAAAAYALPTAAVKYGADNAGHVGQSAAADARALAALLLALAASLHLGGRHG